MIAFYQTIFRIYLSVGSRDQQVGPKSSMGLQEMGHRRNHSANVVFPAGTLNGPAAVSGTVVFNIPASTSSIPQNAGDVKKKKLMPKGAIQSRTDFGTDGYGGPCPPERDKPHHYIFTVYAVDEDKLQFAKDHNVSAPSSVLNCISTARQRQSLIATYGR
jgi:Raf kinase inhibitor-like YbhB/YbcL family protein